IQILYQGSAILKVIETRWAGHVRATNAIYENYTEIVNVLPQVREKCDMKFDAYDIAIATGLQRAIQTPKQNTTVQRDIISRVYANNSKRDE
ncbi:hypothetical protein Bhyg_11822, partial [Pseudolycoriella hygida]